MENSIKIAVTYSGLLNSNFINYYNNHKHYIYNNYNVDFFISTYIDDDTQKNLDTILKIINIKNLHICNYKDIEEIFIEFKNKFIKKHTRDCRPINALSMFYNIKQAFLSIENPNEYNIIIRNRFDILYNQQLFLDTNSFLNVPAGGDYRKGLMDLFAYGSPDIMKKYCMLYDYIQLYMENNITFHPESILRYHCIQNNIPIKRFAYNIFLRGINFTHSAPCFG